MSGTEYTAEQLERAARAYRFNLECAEAARCAVCVWHDQLYDEAGECDLLDIAVEHPKRSRCPLFSERDEDPAWR